MTTTWNRGGNQIFIISQRVIIFFAKHDASYIHRPDQEVTKKYNLKYTLKKLCLKAVFNHRDQLILIGLEGLSNLRKKTFRANKMKH
jgi:hypothetical protein